MTSNLVECFTNHAVSLIVKAEGRYAVFYPSGRT